MEKEMGRLFLLNPNRCYFRLGRMRESRLLFIYVERRMMQPDISQLKDRLVEEIRAYVHDETILNAFRLVPRHEFVGQFLNNTYSEGKRQWQCVSPDDPQWLLEVYTNRQLVTSVNEQRRPNVSSSHPGIMAKMIQSVKLQRGTRVLEIGIGTGYNAAILATLVANENVVSIDINVSLIEIARERIERTVGPGVTLLYADGRDLQASNDFGAIIVTACHDRVEPSWIRALIPGGRIILNWSKSFSKVFLEAEKVDSGLVGRVADFCGDFMDLHDGHGAKIPLLPYEVLPKLVSLDFRAQLVQDFDFGFFLQVNIPSLALYQYRGKSSGIVSYSVRDDANRLVHFSSTSVSGDTSLWEEIQALYEKFKGLGSPKRKRYELMVDDLGLMTFLYDGHEIGVIHPFVSR